MAWVETFTGQPVNGHAPISTAIHIAGRGLQHSCVPVETYNPHFGCHVELIRFFDDALITVYREKHLTVVSRLEIGTTEQTLLAVTGPTATVDDLLLSPDHEHSCIRVLRLPDLHPCLPLPVAPAEGPDRVQLRSAPEGASAHWREGRSWPLRLPTRDQRGFPDRRDLWERLRAELVGPDLPTDGPSIMIGAVTPFLDHPFVSTVTGRASWQDPAAPPPDETSRLYHELPDVPERCDAPWWFPAGYYHYLRTDQEHGGAGRPDEASRWLDWLERLATEHPDQRPGGWEPQWELAEGATHLALTAIRLHAGLLAEVCRDGRLPDLPWAETHVAETPWRYPKGFRRAWSRLPRRFRPGSFRQRPQRAADC
ncbi:hypothetical protein SAMN02982929_05939 [Saccharopolyspora kobensis]|uniref:Uncharacterized protein n=1 Tax=Saccharopolyspora kobensis TaxID=146035 RepID=A0A1H6E9T2_9PSEU|nr:hypothetical protein SAMN02982929_05939 [Saccharopolyspora kobensis]SFD64434.1 hypothetical protein SAMN05216506_105348 [Saccharopolyspora kobensis]